MYKDKVRTSGRVRDPTEIPRNSGFENLLCDNLLLNLFFGVFQVEVAPKREFICFATLFDASMINKDYKGKEIMFELSMGQCNIVVNLLIKN